MKTKLFLTLAILASFLFTKIHASEITGDTIVSIGDSNISYSVPFTPGVIFYDWGISPAWVASVVPMGPSATFHFIDNAFNIGDAKIYVVLNDGVCTTCDTVFKDITIMDKIPPKLSIYTFKKEYSSSDTLNWTAYVTNSNSSAGFLWVALSNDNNPITEITIEKIERDGVPVSFMKSGDYIIANLGSMAKDETIQLDITATWEGCAANHVDTLFIIGGSDGPVYSINGSTSIDFEDYFNFIVRTSNMQNQASLLNPNTTYNLMEDIPVEVIFNSTAFSELSNLTIAFNTDTSVVVIDSVIYVYEGDTGLIDTSLDYNVSAVLLNDFGLTGLPPGTFKVYFNARIVERDGSENELRISTRGTNNCGKLIQYDFSFKLPLKNFEATILPNKDTLVINKGIKAEYNIEVSGGASDVNYTYRYYHPFFADLEVFNSDSARFTVTFDTIGYFKVSCEVTEENNIKSIDTIIFNVIDAPTISADYSGACAGDTFSVALSVDNFSRDHVLSTLYFDFEFDTNKLQYLGFNSPHPSSLPFSGEYGIEANASYATGWTSAFISLVPGCCDNDKYFIDTTTFENFVTLHFIVKESVAHGLLSLQNYEVDETPMNAVSFDYTTFALPNAEILSDDSGDTVILTATGGSTFLWSNGSTTDAILVMESGMYSAIVTDANGCKGRDSISIVISEPQYSFLKGSVYADLNPVLDGEMIAYTYSNANNKEYTTDIVNGQFNFANLPKDVYILQAVPGVGYNNIYFSTYYVNSLYAERAYQLNIRDNDGISGIKIYLQSKPVLSGSASINGLLTSADSSISLSGKQVFLLDAEKNIVAETFTNSNGEYSFDNLPSGTYQSYVNTPGYSIDSEPIVLGTGQTHTETCELNQTTNDNVITNDNVVSESIVYPNPVNNVSVLDVHPTIQYSLVHVYNSLGELVKVYYAGNKIEINKSDYPSGIYLFGILDETGRIIDYGKFVIR